MFALKLVVVLMVMTVFVIQSNALKCHVGYEKLPNLNTVQECAEVGSACILLTSHHDKSRFASCEHNEMCKGKNEVETEDFTVKCCRTELCNKL